MQSNVSFSKGWRSLRSLLVFTIAEIFVIINFFMLNIDTSKFNGSLLYLVIAMFLMVGLLTYQWINWIKKYKKYRKENN